MPFKYQSVSFGTQNKTNILMEDVRVERNEMRLWDASAKFRK